MFDSSGNDHQMIDQWQWWLQLQSQLISGIANSVITMIKIAGEMTIATMKVTITMKL